MPQIGGLEIPDSVTPRDVREEINKRLRLLRHTINANEGSALYWTGSALPTAEEKFRGRHLYWDRGQGGTADELHFCHWNGAALVWTQLV
jgi:hypothetical protein